MHDPLRVVGTLRRPPLTARERRGSRSHPRRHEPDPERRIRRVGFVTVLPRKNFCASCGGTGRYGKSYEAIDIFAGDTCRGCSGRGWRGPTPDRQRIRFSLAFWHWRDRKWFLPSVVTLWHRDPEIGGDDDSCRRGYARRAQAAEERGAWVAAIALRWCARYYGWFHIHHWQIQVSPLQDLRRWLFTRCEACGQRFPFGYSPVSDSWDRPRRRRWWDGEIGLYHHDCERPSAARPSGDEGRTGER